MSLGTVRNAVQAWIAGTTGLSACYRGQPTYVGAEAFENNGVFGPIAFVHVEHGSETRIGLPAGAGLKEVTYDIGVILIVRHIIQPNEDAHDAWVDDVDTAVENLRARIRQDFMFGTGGTPIWQAGEAVGDIQFTLDLPKFEGGIVENWVLVQFKATEMVQPV